MILGLSAESIAIILASAVTATVAIARLINWLGSAKLSETIITTIKTSIPEISKLGDLTNAVTRLTDALDTQSRDTKKLDETISGLDKKIQKISDDMSDLSIRTTSLERATPTVAATAEATAVAVARVLKEVLHTSEYQMPKKRKATKKTK